MSSQDGPLDFGNSVTMAALNGAHNLLIEDFPDRRSVHHDLFYSHVHCGRVSTWVETRQSFVARATLSPTVCTFLPTHPFLSTHRHMPSVKRYCHQPTHTHAFLPTLPTTLHTRLPSTSTYPPSHLPTLAGTRGAGIIKFNSAGLAQWAKQLYAYG